MFFFCFMWERSNAGQCHPRARPPEFSTRTKNANLAAPERTYATLKSAQSSKLFYFYNSVARDLLPRAPRQGPDGKMSNLGLNLGLMVNGEGKFLQCLKSGLTSLKLDGTAGRAPTWRRWPRGACQHASVSGFVRAGARTHNHVLHGYTMLGCRHRCFQFLPTPFPC